MKYFSLLPFLLVISCEKPSPAPVATAPTPAPVAPIDPDQIKSSVVRVNSTQQVWNPGQPWEKGPAKSRRALAALVEGNLILTSAEMVTDATFLELESTDGTRHATAKVINVDYEANLTLLGLEDPEKDKTLIELLTFVLEKGHYNPAVIDDAFSKQVYAEYIKSLDPSKRFLLQSDINEFSKYETRIDDAIRNKDLTFFDLTYNRLVKRMNESKAYYKVILEKPFDYTIKEEISTDYDEIPYAADVDAIKERWRKQLKLSSLSYLVDKQETQ